MAHDGYKILDSDTHVYEPADIIVRNLDPQFRDAIQPYVARGNRLDVARKSFPRRLGTFDKVVSGGANVRYHGTKPFDDTNENPQHRIEDMDKEGIDVDVIIPSRVGSFCAVPDVELELAVNRSYHRYMKDYCEPYPDRLCGVMVVSGRDVEASVKEMYEVGKERWCVGIFPSIPEGMPLDAPTLEPIWAACDDLDLTVALHTFTFIPPFSPGSDDSWENGWLARSAAHPWCGMRNMAALLGAGVMDRYPNLRVALLEAGHGWLPYWLVRLDEQADYMKGAVPEGMRRISEYVASGRYFQSIELHEGQAITKYVIDTLGPDVLMFGSDYPHGESWFPKSVESYLDWTNFDDAAHKKMLWDNAARAFPRALG